MAMLTRGDPSAADAMHARRGGPVQDRAAMLAAWTDVLTQDVGVRQRPAALPRWRHRIEPRPITSSVLLPSKAAAVA
jgi:hypothetical protein